VAEPPAVTGDQNQAPAGETEVDRTATYRTIGLRVMPLLVICYIVSFTDRTNIGIAQQGLKRDLGFGPAVYGLGVTLFFVGFILFEVPSNTLLARIVRMREQNRDLDPLRQQFTDTANADFAVGEHHRPGHWGIARSARAASPA